MSDDLVLKQAAQQADWRGFWQQFLKLSQTGKFQPGSSPITQTYLRLNEPERALVYQELHRLAHRHLAQERGDVSLQTSALINEAYLRLVDVKQVDWQNRAHFFDVSARGSTARFRSPGKP